LHRVHSAIGGKHSGRCGAARWNLLGAQGAQLVGPLPVLKYIQLYIYISIYIYIAKILAQPFLPNPGSDVERGGLSLQQGIIYPYIWVNYNDLTVTEPWNNGSDSEIIPKWP